MVITSFPHLGIGPRAEEGETNNSHCQNSLLLEGKENIREAASQLSLPKACAARAVVRNLLKVRPPLPHILNLVAPRLRASVVLPQLASVVLNQLRNSALKDFCKASQITLP